MSISILHEMKYRIGNGEQQKKKQFGVWWSKKRSVTE
jgi:hypothetical protein